MRTRSFRFFAVALLAGLCFLAGSHNSTTAAPAHEWGPGKWMNQAVDRVVGAVKFVSDKTEYGYDNDICILAAFLAPKGKVAINRTFRAGQKYAIIGAGDNDVEDLDLEVVDSTGNVIAKDDKADAIPVVTFRVPKTDTYTVRQHLYKAKRGSFCCIAVLREGGWDVPIRNLTAASEKLTRMCNIFDSKTPKTVKFLDQTNQWALYGSIARKGESFSITNLNLGAGKRVIMAAGDAQATDIDLYVLNEDNDVLHKDEDPDANPFISFQARRRPSHGIRVKHADGRGPSLILTTVLDVSD